MRVYAGQSTHCKLAFVGVGDAVRFEPDCEIETETGLCKVKFKVIILSQPAAFGIVSLYAPAAVKVCPPN